VLLRPRVLWPRDIVRRVIPGRLPRCGGRLSGLLRSSISENALKGDGEKEVGEYRQRGWKTHRESLLSPFRRFLSAIFHLVTDGSFHRSW